jgi:hypothetical protein
LYDWRRICHGVLQVSTQRSQSKRQLTQNNSSVAQACV